MNKFVILRDAENDTEVIINPATVRALRPGYEGGTIVIFDKDHEILVDGEPACKIGASVWD